LTSRKNSKSVETCTSAAATAPKNIQAPQSRCKKQLPMSTAQMSSNSYSYLSLRVVTLTLQWRCTDFFKKGHPIIKPPTEASSNQTWMMSQVLFFPFMESWSLPNLSKKIIVQAPQSQREISHTCANPPSAFHKKQDPVTSA